MHFSPCIICMWSGNWDCSTFVRLHSGYSEKHHREINRQIQNSSMLCMVHRVCSQIKVPVLSCTTCCSSMCISHSSWTCSLFQYPFKTEYLKLLLSILMSTLLGCFDLSKHFTDVIQQWSIASVLWYTRNYTQNKTI